MATLCLKTCVLPTPNTDGNSTGIWVLITVDTYVNANMCLCSSIGGWASIFIHTLSKKEIITKKYRENGYRDNWMLDKEFGARATHVCLMG